MNIHIETNRLLLRDLEASDAPGIFALDADPEVHRYLGNTPIKTMQQAEEVIAMVRQQYRDNGIGRWAVIDKKTSDFMGWAGLKHEQKLRQEFSYYDLGFRLRPQYWGKGIATETARESLKYGFSTMNLSEIAAAADVANLASNAVLKKVGLSYKELFYYEETPVNWFELTKEDWSKTTTK